MPWALIRWNMWFLGAADDDIFPQPFQTAVRRPLILSARAQDNANLFPGSSANPTRSREIWKWNTVPTAVTTTSWPIIENKNHLTPRRPQQTRTTGKVTSAGEKPAKTRTAARAVKTSAFVLFTGVRMDKKLSRRSHSLRRETLSILIN